MNIIFFYIFSRILIGTFLLLSILTGVVWLAQSLKFIEIIVSHDISILAFFQLISYLIPDLLSNLLPISFLLAGIYTFHKLSTDHELPALHATGMSSYQIYRPIAIASTVIFFVVILTNIYLIPASFKQFRDFDHEIRNHFSVSLIRTGIFNIIKNNTVYVQSKNDKGELENVFIYQERPYKTLTTIAQRGFLESTSGGYVLKLIMGQRQEHDLKTGQMSQFHFETFAYNMNDLLGSHTSRALRPYEKTLTELLFPDASTNTNLKARMRAEGHQRILTPLLVFLDGILIAMFMTHPSPHRSRYKYNFMILAVLGFLIHGGMFLLINTSVKFPPAIQMAYTLIFVSILLCFMGLKSTYLQRKISAL